MATNLTIYVDMDGVVADFVGGACRAHGRPNPFTDAKTAKACRGVFEMIDVWGITKEQFWKPIDKLGVGFWLGLSRTKEATEIINTAYELSPNVAFLTAPSDDPGCVPGKKAWIGNNYPTTPVIYAAAKAKCLLAHPSAILIDDKDSNVAEFCAAGGHAILVPRLWNKLAGTDTLTYVRSQASALHTLLKPTSRPVLGCGMAAAPRQGASLSVQRVAGSITETYRPAARGHRRGVPSDDICLLSCSNCGAVHSSAKRHACHPDEGGDPEC